MKLGLKLGSSGTVYIPEAKRLWAAKMFDYLELFLVADTFDRTIDHWRALNFPLILHAPHALAGMNFSLPGHEAANRKRMAEVSRFCETLKPKYVIFHAGLNGTLKEAIRQMRQFAGEFPEPFRIGLIENKPKIGIHGETCVGYSAEQMKEIMAALGLGFCLDFGHAICAAVSLKTDEWRFLKTFRLLKPSLYHLSDGLAGSETDSHKHLGAGSLDLKKIIALAPQKAWVTLETAKNSTERLDDFAEDAAYFKRAAVE